MPKQEIKTMKDKMDKVIDHLKEEYIGIRTGRAHPGLVSDIKIDYYGSQTPIKQLATISVPEARQIVIAPFDKSVLKGIEKAIQASSLGINPQNDGENVRLTLPELTKERRVELSKVVAKYAEEARIAVRNLRRDSNDVLKKMEKDSTISEDDLRKYTKEVQDITDDYIKKIDEILKSKEKEIIEGD
ncbi:MAG: ribosome recycling factor [Aminobacterium sp.]|uniref:ribosome recycling factor n=1 Tax=unclassified Aminobacterium TaxID=2685012 RepID=UPI001BD0693B|nr:MULTISPECIES: ribosome recycling factor [unclassified Aminobacterium]MDD2205744.1 ribosome recycling factor [Aminobacterium sp.]MDD3707908.1 ribosome recycling factor [Aminobacterium sp.]MDD4229233.1 ribosome recycling factor [Aminobacterium sp.]MDD4551990.1 ribosome recycling factor [Aminobacterium sp.]MEA4878225.1 ribosome recycling factor [Aminobacterium sp.]